MLLMKKHRQRYPALEAAMSAAVEGAVVGFDTASRIESRYLAKVAVGGVAKNMIRTFFFQITTSRQARAGRRAFPALASDESACWGPD
jgi:3-hydroxyacyl-CoA dehydrogenase/enoyl-CoA hydratase/3-hydroxybutyryl-CoA epimerase